MAAGNVLAKAVYDNLAETADELEFRRGDIVTVIEQNTAGLEGWWLCSLNGRQGIAPGNRLKLIPIMHGIAQQQPLLTAYQMADNEDEEYDIPTHQYLPINESDPSEVYDVPVSRNFGSRPELDQDPEEVYDVPPPPALQTSLIKVSQEKLLTSSPQHRTITIEQEVYDIPSNLIAPLNMSSITSEQDPTELYDVPPSRSGTVTSGEPEELYDVPVSNKVTAAEPLDVSAMLQQEEEEDEEYDIPSSRPTGQDTIDGLFSTSNPPSKNFTSLEPSSPDLIYDVPSSNRLVGTRQNITDTSINLSAISTASRFSPGNMSLTKQESEDYVYDIPPHVTRDQPIPTLRQEENESLDTVMKRLSLANSSTAGEKRKSTSSNESLSSIIAANAKYRELNLELSSAIDKLIKLKQSLEDSVSNLLTHVFEGWRLKEHISGKIGIIKSVFESVLTTVAQYVEFARGAMANANSARERGLASTLPRSLITGMHKLLQPLEEDNLMLQQAHSTLNDACWSLSKLVSEGSDIGVPDEIDSFVMTSRAVSDDARQMAAYIHTHSQYLFKKVETRVMSQADFHNAQKVIQTRPLPDVPPPQAEIQSSATNSQRQNEESLLEDYDYVALEEQSTPEISRHTASKNFPAISSEVKTRHLEVLRVLELSNQNNGVPNIIPAEANDCAPVMNDHFTLQDMVDDVPLLVDSLVGAIKQFYASIDSGDPPKSFVSLSKQVILCAHGLVFCGDTLYRRLQHEEMQEIVKGHCAQLCTSLKKTVVATKHAAQQWPSGNAVQEMVDRVTDITASAHQFRILLSQCTVR